MEKRVKITHDESTAVESLFMQFNAYCGILGYLSNYGTIDTEKFDKKWAEAIEIEIQLDKMKTELDKKYHPTEGNFLQYSFSFDTDEMVYT